MNKLITLFLCIITFQNQAQEITGDWYGKLDIQGTKLEFVLHISKENNLLTSTFDSPDQKVFGIPVTETVFENNILRFAIPEGKIQYEGTWQNDGTISGGFNQGGMKLPLHFSRTKNEAPKRPQEPQPPFDYVIKEVTFENKKDNVSLAGTLTLPSKGKNFPVVILISGSGPQDRNEEVLGHKPFWVIADFLTKNGIAVLRYDDRGVAQSTGDFATATSEDFAKDTQAAVAFLKQIPEINPKKISLIGHSEGGLIAPIVAANNPEINNLVLLAGPGVSGEKILLEQNYLSAKLQGIPEEQLAENRKLNQLVFDKFKNEKDLNVIKNKLRPVLKTVIENQIGEADIPESEIQKMVEKEINTIATPWFQFFLTYDPEISLSKVRCPVLILNGEKDFQVPSKMNIEAIENILSKSGNKKYQSVEFPNMNHLFQVCNTGSLEEYQLIEETINPLVLDTILTWLKTQFK